MKKLKFLIIAIAQGVLATQLSAQILLNNDTVNRNRAYIKAGIEPATMITLGYQRNFNSEFLKNPITGYAEWKVSAFRFSTENSELKVGGMALLFQKRGFIIGNNLVVSAGSLSSRHFNSKKFAAADEIALGIYKQGWFVATLAEYEKIVLNHIKHSDFYRETYYEDAKDGWYKGAGGMFQFGIEGGVTIKRRYDMHLEMKMPFTERFDGYGGSPFHVNLVLGYRF